MSHFTAFTNLFQSISFRIISYYVVCMALWRPTISCIIFFIFLFIYRKHKFSIVYSYRSKHNYKIWKENNHANSYQYITNQDLKQRWQFNNWCRVSQYYSFRSGLNIWLNFKGKTFCLNANIIVDCFVFRHEELVECHVVVIQIFNFNYNKITHKIMNDLNCSPALNDFAKSTLKSIKV